jgi:hypothetical protein
MLFLRFAVLLFATRALACSLIGLTASQAKSLAHLIELRLLALMQLVFLTRLKIDDFIVHIEMLAPKLPKESWPDALTHSYGILTPLLIPLPEAPLYCPDHRYSRT